MRVLVILRGGKVRDGDVGNAVFSGFLGHWEFFILFVFLISLMHLFSFH